MKIRLVLSRCGLTLMYLLLAGATAATTYRVDPSGSDTNPGTNAQPFKTIAHAADIVVAGDTVLINPGTYTARVVVKHSGTQEQPITFLSVKRHGAVMTESFTESNYDPDSPTGGSIHYITVKGIKFSVDDPTYHTGCSQYYVGVTASPGWRYEDCLVRGFGCGMCGRGGAIALIRCIFEDLGTNGMSFADGKNWEVTDSIFRRCNQTAYSPGGYVGACKILVTENCRVDGLVSYDNYGSGWWLDWNNRYFSITNSTIFGNHAGEAHEGKDVSNEDWAGPGIWSECNPGPALIENNVIYSNVSGGIGLMESSNHIIRNNYIVDCADCIGMRAMANRGTIDDDTQETPALGKQGPNVITNNYFKGWRDAALDTPIPGSIAKTPVPALAGQFIDNNTYQPGTSQHIMTWVKTTADSLDEARSKLAIEPHGIVASIDFKPALIHVKSLTIDETKDPAKMHQVPAAEAEKLTIDDAITRAGAKVGDTVTIPVFGRKAIDKAKSGPWNTEVYDLQGRYVPITMASDAVKDAIMHGITQFAFLKPVYMKVKLTKLEEYDLEATAIGIIN